MYCFPGVLEHGMLDNLNKRQPGRPCRVFRNREYAGQAIKSEKGKLRGRESDDGVVPKKAGNAAGGKAVTSRNSVKGKYIACTATTLV